MRCDRLTLLAGRFSVFLRFPRKITGKAAYLPLEALMRIVSLGHAVLALFAGVGSAYGDVTVFSDKDAWIAAVGPFATADFTGFPDGTRITNQYGDLGVTFADITDFVLCCSESTFPNDGAGLDGNEGISLVFDTPQAHIAVDFPGTVKYQLFRQGELIHSSVPFGGVGAGFFIGLVSTELFDAALLTDPFDDNVVLDDLHFGAPVCPGDLDGSGDINHPDLVTLIEQWGTNPGGPPDFDGDGIVAVPDLLLLLGAWGPCP